jgi:PadR family transcriptional regulator PadR
MLAGRRLSTANGLLLWPAAAIRLPRCLTHRGRIGSFPPEAGDRDWGIDMQRMPLVRGTLDVLVLRALNWGPMHGFEITTWLEERSAGTLGVEDGALYHALVRLEERGSIEAEWGETENGRRARYYKLTATGRAYLRAETARWLEYASAVTGILTSPRSA